MSMPDLDRKMLAILVADVVGYSRMMEADEAGTIARLTSIRAELIDPAIAKHHGRIVKLLGDGVLVTFESVVDAVACAAEIQDAGGTAATGSEMPLTFRIGVNLGDVALIDGDVYGDGVNVAARLQEMCEPGGVMVSGTAFDHLQGKLNLAFDHVGDQHVKNISRPVRVYRLGPGATPVRHGRARKALRWTVPAVGSALVVLLLLVAAGAAWWLRPQEPSVTKPSIAVLPFDNLGGDAATGRLANGITEDIITDLSRIRKIDVIARNSTEIYKGRPVDPRQVGKDLNVRYVFEGSVQRQGDQIRITAQLIDAATGVHAWSDRWDRPAQDLFAIQTEIAEHIVGQMEVTYGPLNTPDLAAARRKQPENLTAYELNLLGVEKQLNPTRESVEESIKILQQAVKADPNYARAWINLAWGHMVLPNYGGDWASENGAALEAAERAVQLDPNDAEAHSVLGNAVGMNGDLGRAKAEFDESLRLNPSSAGILTYYVGWASTFGEAERGAEMADRAIRLNPNYQSWAAGPFRYAYFMAGRYEDALRVMERETPESYGMFGWAERAGSFAALGRNAEALATVKQALEHFPDLTVEGIANSPGFSAAERQRYLAILPATGIPPCAAAAVLAGIADPVRLPECEKRATP
jgi:TolB-like protein/class 3 adenylate cyclase/tetratricopeptide (TPR) repeat protein